MEEIFNLLLKFFINYADKESMRNRKRFLITSSPSLVAALIGRLFFMAFLLCKNAIKSFKQPNLFIERNKIFMRYSKEKKTFVKISKQIPIYLLI